MLIFISISDNGNLKYCWKALKSQQSPVDYATVVANMCLAPAPLRSGRS